MGLLINLLLANYMIDRGELRIGDFVLVNTYILQIYIPLNLLGTMWRFIRQAMVDVEQIFELLYLDSFIREPERPEPCRIKRGEIEFRNVSFTYDKDQKKEETDYIIENLSFRVPAGKSVALVGATGSGKSTIMRLLYRFYQIDSGEILIDGQNIESVSLNDLRSKIAIVP